MADRDKNFYRELILRANTDLGLDKKNELFPDGALLRLIDTLAKLDQGDENIFSGDPDYNPFSEEEYEDLMGNEEIADFLNDAIAKTEARRADMEAGEGDDSSEDGDEGIDSVGDGEDESEEKEKPDALTVSDEGKKEKGSPPKKGSGCVSDKGMKKVRRKEGPSEELLTRRNIAATLKDLRF